MALGIAAGRGDLEMVKVLTNHKAKTTRKAMENAIANGHLEMIKWLHADRSERYPSSGLCIAARNGQLEIVKWLINNQIGSNGSKAVKIAVAHGHLAVVEWLQEINSHHWLLISLKPLLFVVTLKLRNSSMNK